MTAEQGNENRREIIGRLECRYQQAKAHQAKADAPQAEHESAQLEAARCRAQEPFPPGDIWQECWIMYGRQSDLYPVAHDDPAPYDRMMCGVCDYFEDRQTGS